MSAGVAARAAITAAATAALVVGSMFTAATAARAGQATRPAAVADPAAAALQAAVEATVRPFMARHRVPGMAVAVVAGDHAAVFNYGVASAQGGAPVTASTLFEIGSVSKMFTATLAAAAQADGRLSLDDHPGRHLPALAGRPIDEATLLHLGTYTAGGLPLQFPDTVTDDDDALEYFRRWTPQARPGALRQYSNPSIGLLGAATAAALQQDFAGALAQHVLQPLGLRHTLLRVPPEAEADLASGHRDGRPVRLHPGPLADPAYGLRATAPDLLRFVQAQIDPGALPGPLREAVRLTQRARFRVGPLVQGFGWEQLPFPLSRRQLLAGHAAALIFEPNPARPEPASGADAGPPATLFNKTGSTGGFAAYLAFVPAQRLGVVLLANASLPIDARVAAGHAILMRLRAAAPAQPAVRSRVRS